MSSRDQRSPAAWLIALLASFVAPGCRPFETEEEFDEIPTISFSEDDDDASDEEEVATRLERLELQFARRSQARGAKLYRFACATCHGLEGDGNGASASQLSPKPRDFTRGVYKWRSTESGSLPVDEDIFRTISRGVPGTRMVAWRNLLSESERRDLVSYLKSFSDRFEEEGVEPDEVVQIPESVEATPQSVARGKEVYEEQKCWQCHGRSGRGDGPAAPTLKDSWDNPIKPFDFTLGQYRCGTTDRAVYRTFFTGLNGTPMPSYGDTIPEEDRWPLVHYVRSLQRSPGFFERFVFETP